MPKVSVPGNPGKRAVARKKVSDYERSSQEADIASGADQLLNREQAARFLGVCTQTLAMWHCKSKYGLPLIKVGRCVRYRKGDLLAFVESRVVTNSVEADALRARAAKSATGDRDAHARRILGG